MASRLLTVSLSHLAIWDSRAWAEAPASKAKVACVRAPAAVGMGTVGIVTGDVDSTGIRVASDLSRLLDTSNSLRIIPMIGKGSFKTSTTL